MCPPLGTPTHLVHTESLLCPTTSLASRIPGSGPQPPAIGAASSVSQSRCPHALAAVVPRASPFTSSRVEHAVVMFVLFCFVFVLLSPYEQPTMLYKQPAVIISHNLPMAWLQLSGRAQGSSQELRAQSQERSPRHPLTSVLAAGDPSVPCYANRSHFKWWWGQQLGAWL